MVRIVRKEQRLHGYDTWSGVEATAEREPDRLAIGDDLGVAPLQGGGAPVGGDGEAPADQVHDGTRLLRGDRRIEQTLGRIDVQVVRNVEHVRDQRAFDGCALETKIEIAERYGMCERGAWSNEQRRGNQDDGTKSGPSFSLRAQRALR